MIPGSPKKDRLPEKQRLYFRNTSELVVVTWSPRPRSFLAEALALRLPQHQLDRRPGDEKEHANSKLGEPHPAVVDEV